MENPSESLITAPDAVIADATNFINGIEKLTDEEIMEQIDLGALIRDTQNLVELYSSNDKNFLDITKRVRSSELFRFTSDNSKLLFDDSELKEWLKSCDDSLFTVIVEVLAENLYKSLSEKMNERAILESIDQSKDPEAARALMKSAKDHLLFYLENLLKQRFKNVIQTTIDLAKERTKTKRVVTCWN